MTPQNTRVLAYALAGLAIGVLGSTLSGAGWAQTGKQSSGVASSGAGAGAGGLGGVAPSLNGQGGVDICFAHQKSDHPDTLMVIPSGTVFVARRPANGRKDPAQMEGLVTTETVTLTEMQPCGMADASTLVSRTRHWLINPVRPQVDVTFQPVGEVSGNGVDMTFEDEASGFQAAVKAGIITAHVEGPLHDTVYLSESPADIEDPDAPSAGTGPETP
ncbi:hypothetical protein K6W36_00845 [Acetobacter senegalensis]|uniref:hypothetical protein n=1 Tax=Acetobacter senegalensis TaxID=446692 RepID=UPI001EDB699F|nr:hypothetical protein [Acetobacter senegalensis]MCG4259135.1 hypothetical protein [Acetobacter senegalensis]